MAEAHSLERLEAAWRAARSDAALAVALAGELARHGRRASAHKVLDEALCAGADGVPLAEAAARLSLGRWSGTSGGWPLRTWLGRAPQTTPVLAWDEKVVRADLRYGRPCIAGTVLGLVARSTVVGGRFVELFGRDLEGGALLWRCERRNIIAPAPMFALETDGRAPALGWAYARILDDDDGAAADDGDDEAGGGGGVELVVEVFDAASGELLARHGQVLAQAQVVSGESGPLPLANGDLAWGVSWLDEAQRHDVLFVIDGGSGALRGPLAEASPALLRDAARASVALDDAGARLVVEPWPAAPATSRARVGLCAAPHGPRFAALEAATGGWQLARLDGPAGGWRVLGRLGPPGVELSNPASTMACWMGGDLVLAAPHGRQTLLWACRASDGAALWQVELDGIFHTAPVPMPWGVLALGGERVVALRAQPDQVCTRT